jgi:L-ascorbate peroxidase
MKLYRCYATLLAAAVAAVHLASSVDYEINADGTIHETASVNDLQGAQDMIDAIILEKNCNPIFVRLAWHDSGTYDVNLKDEPWPKAGGAIGSIRFAPEITHGANAGLANAIALLEPVKAAYPIVSYADLFQMASARSIELAGGPKIDMK